MNNKFSKLTLSIIFVMNSICLAQNESQYDDRSQYNINPISYEQIKQVDIVIDSLKAVGVFEKYESFRNESGSVRFEFPLSFTPDTANGIYFNYLMPYGAYFDHDNTNGLLDYTGGNRTYDGHKGTDWSLSPFRWHSMDNDLVSVIAAAPGVIVTKIDGKYDRVCSWNDPLNNGWNGIIIKHADGTRAWYIHFKKYSLTKKNVGDYVETGEYLGVVGSSGKSGGPHLHFQVMTENNVAIDPFFGAYNSDITESLWANQPEYIYKGINRLLIGSSPPIMPPCPQPEILNEKRTFIPGDSITFSVYSRFLAQDLKTCRVRKPDGTIWDEINGVPRDVDTWNKQLPNNAPLGVWHYEVEYNSNTFSLSFLVEESTSINPTINHNKLIFNVFPNPLNSSTTFSWQSEVSENTKLTIYDQVGIKVKTIVDEFRQKGYNELVFSEIDLPSGVYYCKLQVGEYFATVQIIILK